MAFDVIQSRGTVEGAPVSGNNNRCTDRNVPHVVGRPVEVGNAYGIEKLDPASYKTLSEAYEVIFQRNITVLLNVGT